MTYASLAKNALSRALVGAGAVIRRLVRRLDHVADRYEASVDEERGRERMDWALSALLCLWTVVQVGVLTYYLQVFPLF